MIEKTVSGKILDSGKKYKGNYEQGVYVHVKDEKDGKTYIACFACENDDDGIPWEAGQYLILSGHLRHSRSKFDEIDVLHISIPHIEFFDEMEN